MTSNIKIHLLLIARLLKIIALSSIKFQSERLWKIVIFQYKTPIGTHFIAKY